MHKKSSVWLPDPGRYSLAVVQGPGARPASEVLVLACENAPTLVDLVMLEYDDQGESRRVVRLWRPRRQAARDLGRMVGAGWLSWSVTNNPASAARIAELRGRFTGDPRPVQLALFEAEL